MTPSPALPADGAGWRTHQQKYAGDLSPTWFHGGCRRLRQRDASVQVSFLDDIRGFWDLKGAVEGSEAALIEAFLLSIFSVVLQRLRTQLRALLYSYSILTVLRCYNETGSGQKGAKT